jgi:hypothetical protein
MSFLSSVLAFCFFFFSVFYISAFSLSTLKPHPLHPSITYFYRFFYWVFFLSKGQIDQWNVTGPSMEEDTQADYK